MDIVNSVFIGVVGIGAVVIGLAVLGICITGGGSQSRLYVLWLEAGMDFSLVLAWMLLLE